MIKTQIRQLFDSRLALGLIFSFPLAGFCLYVVLLQPRFILSLSVSLLFLLGIFIYQHFRLVWLRAEAELKRQDFQEKANLLEAQIERQWVALKSARKKLVDYFELKTIAEKLNQSFSLSDTSNVLSNEVSKLFGHKDLTVILYIFHSKTGELGISASHKGQMEVNIKAKKGDVYDQWVAKNLQPLLIEDTVRDFRFDAEKIKVEDDRTISSLMSVPMMIGGKAIGILRIDSPVENYFQTEHIRLLSTIGDLGAVAIENAQLYEKIEELSIRDSLTELYLRRHFLQRLTYEINREIRQKKELSFVLVDLDYFKKYNDQFGHMAGDIVLKTISMLLAEVFNIPGSLVCRYGGEEFAVFLPDCSKERAAQLSEEFRERVAEQAFYLKRQETRMTVSVGVASLPQDGILREQLIEKADRALYKAKQGGRNRVCVS